MIRPLALAAALAFAAGLLIPNNGLIILAAVLIVLVIAIGRVPS